MNRRITAALLALVATTATFWLPLTVAQAGSSFTFFGAGFGHGVGMSQYGALGLAKQRWSHEDILMHFYSHTTVAQHPLPSTIRVGIVQGIQSFDVQARKGPVELHVGGPNGDLVGTIPKDDWWNIKVGTGAYRITDGGGKLVGGKAWGGRHAHLFATYDHGAMLGVKQNSGISYNRGYLEFNIYKPNPRGRLIAVVSPQEYLYGIGEMPSEWPAEALQAQADASRTYAFELVDRAGKQTWCNCHVTDDTRNQVYVAYAKEGGTSGKLWVDAVDATDGEVVLYKGGLIQAQFMSSSGGYTEDVGNVWGTKLPYLQGVCDPGDYVVGNSLRTWTIKESADQVTSGLRSYTGDIGQISDFSDIRRGVSGRILSATAIGRSGKQQVTGGELRLGLGLYDSRFWIGHNLLVTGALRLKYDAINCRPKLAVAPQDDVGVGVRQRFENGTIFFRSVTGAHWLHGPVLGAFVKAGGPTGALGFPTTDVRLDDNGDAFANFQHGTITCDAGGCSQS